MLNGHPDSDYIVVAATNIPIYCFLVELPVSHKPNTSINKRQYIEDPHSLRDDNLCLFRCVLKKLRPQDNYNDRETHARLMWRIFIGSKQHDVKSDSVIIDHRQLVCENDLLNDVEDYKSLMSEEIPNNKWGAPDVQANLKNMCGVSLDEVKKVEELFDLHIDIFTLKDIEK